ncbi:probable glutathione S-transferase parC [Chenopodium quinoa]|uniref:probable glutathione S-transferase parC n=1 Tax=Chenopodium quinoa TaxID=63459 RepID=UPI000B788192|nr:probable glutathione S-transferase parC [Chenopodium quinoa]
MTDELKLLDYWASPYAVRVKIALKEKGITDYEIQQEDLLNAKSQLLFEINPVYKMIPVLIHNGKPVCESLLIVEYIDEIWKENSPGLLPVDPYQRARARFWTDYFDKTFITFISKLWSQRDEIQQDEKNDFINFLKLFEEELGDKPYFGGNNFGYLDVALIPNYSWFYSYETCTKLSIVSDCPQLIAWAKRCMERDSVKSSMPNELKIYEYVHDLKERFGTI